ncbi:MAG TPA: hypothetical protein VHX44_06225 [Planctomycetota bacterium]|nr:hypothetical protein [Planctomycetota bacterium]
MDLLLWLFTFQSVGTGDTTVVWPPSLPNAATPLMKLLFIGLAIAIGVVVFQLYRREPAYVDVKRKRILATLRTLAGLVLLFICTGAFLEVQHREQSKGTLVLLVDQSQSMGITDRKGDAGADAALEKVIGTAPDKVTRSEQVRRALANEQVAFLKDLSETFAVEAYTFGQGAQISPLELAAGDPAGPLAKLGKPTDPATQLGGALRDTARRLKGRKIDGVVVFSDGGWNRGEEPLPAAEDLNAPVFTVGIGQPRTRDVAVTFVSCEDVVFKGDAFALTVRVRASGYAGQTARLVVRQGDEVVREMALELDDSSERTYTVAVTPRDAGTFTFSAEVEPLTDELSVENNKRERPGVTVVDKKIRVLVVEDSPRWETRFLTSILEADKTRIEASFLMRQADERLAALDRRHLRAFPATPADLRNYDVVVFGNIGVEFFTREELDNLAKFVQQEGGGVLFIAGRNRLPDAYEGSPLADLLPVEIENQPGYSLEDELARTLKTGFRPQLTAEGKRSSLTRLAPEARENDLLWEKSDLMFWRYPAVRMKSGATALATVGSGGGRNGQDGEPVIAMQRYGKGQVIWMGTDETWRWRSKPGPEAHRRFWGQLVASLSQAHLLGKTNRVQLETDKAEYVIGDRTQITARLLDQDFNRRVDDQVTAIVERGALGKEEVVLAAVKDQPGTFQGEFVPGTAGEYRLVIKDEEDEAERLFTAVAPRIEFDDPGMRTELLTQIANATKRRFSTLADLAELKKDLAAQEHVAEPRREERPLWNAPGIMILITLLLGLEWFFRKRWDLL